MIKKKFILLLAVATTAMFLHAADDVNLPKGKPFQVIQSSLDALQSQVDALIGDNINSVEERLSALENAVVALDTNVADNLVLINLMQVEINSLKESIALKQNIINGICPYGQAVISVNNDGSLSCANTTGSSAIPFESVTTMKVVEVLGLMGSVPVGCPSGFIVTGGGYDVGMFYDDVIVYKSYPRGVNAMWEFALMPSGTGVPTQITLYANCIRLK